MPHTRSAAKRLRQSKKNNLANKDARNAVKTYMKKVYAAASAGDLTKAQAELRTAMQKIDKASKIHAMHPNQAARKKSQVSLAVAALLKKQGAAKAKK